ncbi:phospholipase B1, membrane-associated-like [Entelurus aequoreus]|uniref:phospholipase B1, membrane-associated-like n=1 Tax=Entelurus aequoreus TaxID=161455 RepID=UPI002B1E8A7B|nr:phospholipase B1, membrane-associated-like [Entelurus aequoreus]
MDPIMTGSILLILQVLIGSGAVLSDIDSIDMQDNDQIESYKAFLCSPSPLSSLSTPSSVHAVQPADISALYSLSTSLSGRNVTSRLVSQVAELLSIFNPEVITANGEASLQPRSLLQEVEDLSLPPSHQASDWKLVLLFVSADHLSACTQHIDAEVGAITREVEAALGILQEQLHHTLVHVVVCHSSQHKDNAYIGAKQQHSRLCEATLVQKMQDSLGGALEHPKWQQLNFSALLQPRPLILEHSSEDILADVSKLAVQLWTSLLQASRSPSQLSACPTQERPYLRTPLNLLDNRQEVDNRGAALQTDPVMGSEIPCTDRRPSPTTPKSVHDLRPADIKVVAAVGDSLTAGNGVGAKSDNLLLVINEYRGLSWSIGGDENITTVTTLPNILKEFNPSLTGFSQGIGKADSPGAFLNQAVAGATSGDVVKQVRALVARMKKDTRIDFHNDWKVITMFIGGNDICDFCTDSVFFSPRNVAARIRRALDILHDEVPRALVNLVELLDIIPLRNLHKDNTLGCPTWFVRIVCPCVLKPRDGSVELQKVNEYSRAYQHAMRELVDSGRYDTHDNFSVVLQPFYREVFLPTLPDGRPDRSYFSPDCFHLSQRAHTLMARALWNNMLEPVGNKTFTQDFTAGIDLKCPSEAAPFFRTAANSNYTFPGPTPTPPPVTNWGSDFSCLNTHPSDPVPTSAHRVRPADIKVAAALGDSVTTGFGAKAKNLLQLTTEYRGVSWSIGGDQTLETVTTLANILRKFNPHLKGVSKGQGKRRSGFNMSVGGAKVSGIPAQVRRLIDTMKNDTTVDFANDWKLVTLFIGGNDLCQYCNDRASLSPKNFSYHLMMSLDMLYKEVPRTIVNILEILQLDGLRRVKKDSLGCNVLQQLGCPCFMLPSDDSLELHEVKRINREVQMETENLASSSRYDNREDFAVVVQPFFKNSIIPLNADGRPDVTYFSVDCFHFSERGHADMAVAMWNNMLEPVGKKQTYNLFTNARNRIKCPTEEHPYIFTKVNSLPSVDISTTSPPTHSTPTAAAPPTCPEGAPLWLAAVLAVCGLLLGWGLTWLLFTCKAKRSKMRMNATTVEMKSALF